MPRTLLFPSLLTAGLAVAAAQEVPFVARNGSFRIELPAGWRELAPSEARRIGAMPGAPADLGYVEPRMFYAVGPVEQWLAGDFDSPWLWVVEQDEEWLVEDDFAEKLAAMWQQSGRERGVEYTVTGAGREPMGPDAHEVLTAVRTMTPPTGPALRSLDVHAPSGGRMLSLSLTCRADTFDRWQPEFRRWLSTLRFARRAHGEPELGDRLWSPLLTGAAVALVLLLLYKRTRRRG